MAVNVQALLLRCGINARIRSVAQASGYRTQWHVIVSGRDDVLQFAHEIGAVGVQKNEALTAILDFMATREANTNRDVIPSFAWRLFAVPAMQERGITARQLHAQLGQAYCGTTLYRQNMSRDRARRVAVVTESESLHKLAASDVYWDSIVSIEPDGVEEVYDLTVPGTHNFVAGNIIVHNSIEQDADVVLFIYRDDYYNEDSEQQNIADVIVAKHRHGSTGTVSLYFRKELTQFRDLEIQRTELDY